MVSIGSEMSHATPDFKGIFCQEMASIDDFFIRLDVAVVHISVNDLNLARCLDPKRGRRGEASVWLERDCVEGLLVGDQI